MKKERAPITYFALLALRLLREELRDQKFRKAREVKFVSGINITSASNSDKSWERAICNAIPLLAKSLREQKIVSIGKLPIPPGVEAAAQVQDQDGPLCLRVVKAYDVFKGKYHMRIDLGGRTA